MINKPHYNRRLYRPSTESSGPVDPPIVVVTGLLGLPFLLQNQVEIGVLPLDFTLPIPTNSGIIIETGVFTIPISPLTLTTVEYI